MVALASPVRAPATSRRTLRLRRAMIPGYAAGTVLLVLAPEDVPELEDGQALGRLAETRGAAVLTYGGAVIAEGLGCGDGLEHRVLAPLGPRLAPTGFALLQPSRGRRLDGVIVHVAPPPSFVERAAARLVPDDLLALAGGEVEGARVEVLLEERRRALR